jgi:hypothetical protein
VKTFARPVDSGANWMCLRAFLLGFRASDWLGNFLPRLRRLPGQPPLTSSLHSILTSVQMNALI